MLLTLIIIFSVLGSVGAIALAGLLIFRSVKTQKKMIGYFVAYATGTLLGAAFLGMIPSAIEKSDATTVLTTVLVGILLFFVLEKIVIWRHCHKPDCEQHKSTASMILIGDAFHNFVDGVVIAGSFLISIPVGITTSLSVIVHEIPQELGDFAILLHSGLSNKRAFALNVISGLTAVLGGILGYFYLDHVKSAIPYVLALGAASFIYIALVDISPDLNKKTGTKETIQQLLLIVLGVVTIAIVIAIKHSSLFSTH